MSLVTLENVSLAYGDIPLLDEVNICIEDDERIGLIGRNGVGKSTLLKVITGKMPPDSGEIRYRNGATIAFVEQEPVLNSEHTVFEAISDGLGEMCDLLKEYHQLIHALESDHSEPLMDKLHACQAKLDACDGWQLNNRVEQVITRMQLDPDAAINSLSGGYRKRVAIGRALVSEPDLLILDEPTNHLDLQTITWLEELLSAFRGSLLFITHDRRFLNAVANRILELDLGILEKFPGNYEAYRKRKDEQVEVERRHNAKFDKFLKEEEVWIRQGIKARRTRNEGRVRRLEALRKERSKRRERQGNASISIDDSLKSGKLVAELKNVGMSYDDKILFSNFSTRINRGDRIGLLGPNGVGKTTLLKIMLGKLQPESGTVRLGTNLSVAYFDQFREQLDEDAPLTEAVAGGSDHVQVGNSRQHVIGYLNNFLFSPRRARDKVSSLSGGERNRLLLAKLFTQPANILVLDEPTNDLDIETLELLEETLQEYQGTVLLVSHDRDFLDNICTQVLAFDGNGNIEEFAGGYDDWLRHQQNKTAVTTATQQKNRTAAQQKSKARKLSYKEQTELDSLPEKIEALESEQQEITGKLSDGSLYSSDPDQARQLQLRYEEIDELLLTGMARWEELEQLKNGTKTGQ